MNELDKENSDLINMFETLQYDKCARTSSK
jgi:hypothetical protein